VAGTLRRIRSIALIAIGRVRPHGAFLVTATAALALLFIVMSAAIVLPPRLIDVSSILDPAKRLSAVNELRTSLLAILGGFSVLVGSLVAYLTFRETHVNNVRTATHNQDLLDLQLRGQVTDRFTRAAQQLGEEGPGKVPVRIAAVYSLEQIGRDSPQFRQPIGEVLADFIRHASRTPTVASETPPPGDVVAAMVVLRRRSAYIEHTHFEMNRATVAFVGFPGRNLSGASIVRCTIGEADFRAAILAGGTLSRSDFMVATFSGADLHDMTMDRVTFNEADLCGAQLQCVTLVRTDLNGAMLPLVDLKDSTLEHCALRRATLTRASMQGARLTEVDLADSVVGGAALQKVICADVQFDRASLEFVGLQHASMTNCRFRGARLSRAICRGTEFIQCDFEGANLDACDLRDCTMRGVSFRSANLAGVDLRCSQLTDVDFTNAYLTSAVLGDVADASGDAIGLTWQQLKSARNVETAVLPSYLRM
jgi:uncharacterized protein YjbI with pentapeptide repeats